MHKKIYIVVIIGLMLIGVFVTMNKNKSDDLIFKYDLNNAKEIVDLFDKDFEELNIDEKMYVDRSLINIKFSGNYNNEVISGTMSFIKNSENEYQMKSIYFPITNQEYLDVIEEYTSYFSLPINQGEEPYVESNGGVVEFSIFEYKDVLIRVEKASKYDYVWINFNR